MFQRERAELFDATSLCASHVNGAKFTSNVNMNGARAGLIASGSPCRGHAKTRHGITDRLQDVGLADYVVVVDLTTTALKGYSWCRTQANLPDTTLFP